MTSGEWDLRALKALEDEEQQEFLALSQKSLFEAPSPPTQAKLQHQQQINAQNFIHSALAEREPRIAQNPAATTGNFTNYMHLQAQQLLKLPTINEHNHQNLLKNKTKHNDSNEGEAGRLKFTKVLSLSAHSLTNRLSGGVVGLKKPKRTSVSASPSNYGSPTPLYTPPPTRRCNTLHHSQPQVRKTFKTLQQLEKQKQERKLETAQNNKTRTLQRIAGTNKTYWKYGINSTANSITQQHQKQQKLQHRKSITSELESNTSDELGSEETQPVDNQQIWHEERERLKEESENKTGLDPEYDDDTNTEIGSCSVPLATDSIEMMSLMLSAASTAVTTQPSLTSAAAVTAKFCIKPNGPQPDIAATSGDGGDGGAGSTGDVSGKVDYPSYFTLNQHNLTAQYGGVVGEEEEEETVAYEAFHSMLSRRKSFSGEKLLRAQILQRNSSLTHDNDDNSYKTMQHPQQPQHQQHSKSRNVNNRLLLKSSSVEAPLSSYLDINGKSTTVITNPLTANIKTSSTATATATAVAAGKQKNLKSCSLTAASKQHQNFLTASQLLAIPTLKNTSSTELKPHNNQETSVMCSSEHHHYHHNHPYHAHHIHQMFDGSDLNTTSSSLIIDDELEQHIKQCSCSCNHMGYGNSMDYQVSVSVL